MMRYMSYDTRAAIVHGSKRKGMPASYAGCHALSDAESYAVTIRRVTRRVIGLPSYEKSLKKRTFYAELTRRSVRR